MEKKTIIRIENNIILIYLEANEEVNFWQKGLIRRVVLMLVVG